MEQYYYEVVLSDLRNYLPYLEKFLEEAKSVCGDTAKFREMEQLLQLLLGNLPRERINLNDLKKYKPVLVKIYNCYNENLKTENHTNQDESNNKQNNANNDDDSSDDEDNINVVGIGKPKSLHGKTHSNMYNPTPPKSALPTTQSEFVEKVSVNILEPQTPGMTTVAEVKNATSDDNPPAFLAKISNKVVMIPNAFYGNSESVSSTSVETKENENTEYRRWMENFILQFSRPSQFVTNTCFVLLQRVTRHAIYTRIKGIRMRHNAAPSTDSELIDFDLYRILMELLYVEGEFTETGLKFCNWTCRDFGKTVPLTTDVHTGEVTAQTCGKYKAALQKISTNPTTTNDAPKQPLTKKRAAAQVESPPAPTLKRSAPIKRKVSATNKIQNQSNTKDFPPNSNIDLVCVPNNVYDCVLCNRRMSRIVDHYVNEHRGAEVYTSRLLPARLEKLRRNEDNTDISINRVTVESRHEAVCAFCTKKKKFTMLYWQHHFSMHTGEYAYRCIVCGVRKSTRSSLWLHESQTCEKGSAKLTEDYEFNPRVNKIEANVCTLCNYTQLHRKNIVRHLNSQHNIMDIQDHHIETVFLLVVLEVNCDSTSSGQQQVASSGQHNSGILEIQ